MTREEQFNVVTNALLNYDTGDFLLLSDIEDSVALLTDFYLEQEEPYELIQWLLNLIRAEMNKAGQPGFIDNLTKGIDLLQSMDSESSPEAARDLKERMKKLIGSTTNEGVQASGIYHDDESFQIFIAEASDRLVQAQTLILDLEQDFTNLDLINKLFRVFHTIKGECGFLK